MLFLTERQPDYLSQKAKEQHSYISILEWGRISNQEYFKYEISII